MLEEKYCLLFSKISFRSRDIRVFKLCKLAKCWRHTPNQILFQYDEKRYLSQFVSIFCSKILINVLHYMSLTVLLPWHHTGFQTSPILKAFQATFGIPFWYLLTASKHIQQAYPASSSLWPCLTIFKLKITNILKSSGWGLEKSELPWEQNFFYSHRCVSCRTIRLPSFNGLCCKLAKLALFGMSVWRHQSSHLHILPICQIQIFPDPMQIFANGKWRFCSFTEFYVIHSKVKR